MHVYITYSPLTPLSPNDKIKKVFFNSFLFIKLVKKIKYFLPSVALTPKMKDGIPALCLPTNKESYIYTATRSKNRYNLLHNADLIKKAFSVYTLSMTTIYLSLSDQVQLISYKRYLECTLVKWRLSLVHRGS